jgi:hypothetical protein
MDAGSTAVHEVVDAGFSKEIILLLIEVNRTTLAVKNPMPWLLFWRQFLNNNHRLPMKGYHKELVVVQF